MLLLSVSDGLVNIYSRLVGILLSVSDGLVNIYSRLSRYTVKC